MNPSVTGNIPAEPDTVAILAALDAAGLTVTGQQIEADSIDIHLAHRYNPDYAATSLSWRPDGQGWYLLSVEPDDGIEGDAWPHYLGVEDPAQLIEAVAELLDHTTAPAVPDTTPDLTVRQRLADGLHRLADDIATTELPLPHVLSLHLGLLKSRADLHQWADHYGADVQVDSNGIPHIETLHRLTDDRYGPTLRIHAQSPQEPRESELERLRAERDQLRAELEAAKGSDR
ncbi:hypothetical protein [Micromonospora sp. NBRC 101691]|uniref:hypothetical protein n=1 Tax=Micromonospora sp. NBRC 101691 TaxID=3032198 RepID=UPI0024A38354|nr:hypothetical protein [Micromonospora sp. NBRC 101691]GLY21658.1 hypothetical protein Misp04_13900 [Micromonospora sp. NBRC 101691]